MNSTVKTIMFWVFILICLVLLWGVVSHGTIGFTPFALTPQKGQFGLTYWQISYQ